WKGLFTRPTQKRAQQPNFTQFAAASFARFRRLTRIILPIFVLTAVYDLFRFRGWGVGWLVEAEVSLLAITALTIGIDAYGRRQKDPFAEHNLSRFILLLLLLDALMQAGSDVTLAQGGGIRPWFVRWLHLAAFGLWFGGAVWNTFITVP